MNSLNMKRTLAVLAISLLASVALAYGERLSTLSAPAFAYAERSIVCGDSPTPFEASEWDIDVTTSVTGGVKLKVGDLLDRCVPSPLIGALGYLIAWSKGEPRPVNGNSAVLVLPTSGMKIAAQASDSLDHVMVTIVKAQIRRGERMFTGTLTMDMIRVDGRWTVAVVTMP